MSTDEILVAELIRDGVDIFFSKFCELERRFEETLWFMLFMPTMALFEGWPDRVTFPMMLSRLQAELEAR